VKTDTTVYARFTPLRYTFTLMTEGASPIGQVRVNEGTFGTMHTREVYYGDTLRLEANPVKEGYAFTQWRIHYTQDGKPKDSLYSRSSEVSYVVRGETKIVGYFNLNSHHIAATVKPQPSCGEVLNQGNYRHELWMELDAKPAKGYAFGYWKDAEGNIMAEKSPRLQLQSLGDITVQAYFVPDTLPVEVEIWGGREHGAVRGDGRYEYGKNATLEAEPAYGYVFAGWYRADDTLKNQSLSKENPYVFTVRKEERLAAQFTLDRFALSAAVTPEGSGSVRGTGSYPYLTEAILQMVPADGFALKYLLWEREDGHFDTLRENFAGIRMDRAYQVRVYFEPTPYTLQVFSSNMDQGKVQAGAAFAQFGYGTPVSLKAMPEPNYAFSQWRDAWGKRLSRSAEYTFPISCDTLVYADFVPVSKRFRAESQDLRQGYVEDYNNRPSYGSMVTVKAVPNDGYEFDRWVLASDMNTTVSHSSVLSVFVTQDTSFEAKFKPKHRDVRLHANILQAGFIEFDEPQPGGGHNWNNDRYAQVLHGAKIMLYAYPAENYNFSSWVKKDASGQGGITLGEEPVLEIEVN
ncbi:MAG: InlB B-repeat-containing protein, partial [Bacteroidales bacterium]|nr:InlB B-repeat-containing protein [Bacteroidales bacterium]